jgi:hypothetical protein
MKKSEKEERIKKISRQGKRRIKKEKSRDIHTKVREGKN